MGLTHPGTSVTNSKPPPSSTTPPVALLSSIAEGLKPVKRDREGPNLEKKCFSVPFRLLFVRFFLSRSIVSLHTEVVHGILWLLYACRHVSILL